MTEFEFHLLSLLQTLDGKLTRLAANFFQGNNLIMTTLQDIQTAVSEQASVEASVVTLLTSLHDQLTAAIANGADPVALQAIADSIAANTQTLADAVSANTPPTP